MRLYPLGEFIAGHCHTSAQRRDAALPRLVGIVDGEDRQRPRGILLLRLRAVASQRHQRRNAARLRDSQPVGVVGSDVEQRRRAPLLLRLRANIMLEAVKICKNQCVRG